MVTDSKISNGGDAFSMPLVPCSKQNRNSSDNVKEDGSEKKETSLVNGVRIYKRRKLSQSSSEDLFEHARASPEVGGQLVDKRRKLSQSSSEVSPEVGGELVDKQQKKEMVLVNGVGNYEQQKLSQSSSEAMTEHAKTSPGQSVNKQQKKEMILVNGVGNYEQRKLSQSSSEAMTEHAKTSPGQSVNKQQKKEMVLVNGVGNYEQRKLSQSSSEDMLEHAKTSPEVGGQSVNKQRTKEMFLVNGVGLYEQKLSQSSSGDILEHARIFPEVGVQFVDKQGKLSQASSVDVPEHGRTSPEVGGHLLDNQQKLSLSRSDDMQEHARVSPEVGSQLLDKQHKLSQSSSDAMLELARKSQEVGGQVADKQQQLSQSSSKDMLEHARKSPRVLGQSMDKNSAKDRISIVSDVSCDKPNDTDNVHFKKELCQHMLDDVLVSEKFSLLGKLLSENFQGFKIENLSHFININSRIRDGFYGQSPQVFAEDMQQLWTMFHKIGAEMVSLAKGLSDLSWKFYHEHVGGSSNGPCVEGKLEFQEINQVHPGNVQCSGLDITKHYPSQEADRNSKPDQASSCKSCTCRYCGGKTDDRICIVCDACEKMYHVFCVGVSISKESPRSWYCMNCAATGSEQPHENCVVCETPCDPTDVSEDKRDSMANGILRNVGMEANAVHQSAKSITSYSCKLCRCEFVNSHYRECEHSLCHNKFHLRCLSEFELKRFGPRWYCPSCLCRVCLVDRDDEEIVLCDGCDNAYHIYCMEPPLTCVPEGKWFCKVCDRRMQAIHKAKNLYENYESHRQKSNEAGSVGIPSSAKRVLQNHKKDRTTGRSVEAKTAVGNMDMLLNAVEIVQ